ncbi:protein phosphatase 2C domain-containing protein [Spirosoma pollinicola]|uniref:Serine/threonine-protein phosphatase n=1 Tax=Spirosoma pollinicola TaxID=2057025 RepID=A0A2K8YVG9_9BACT|nr:protein phosphatase 2C domain-containing protein [Spirosoma pollinicola]AUD01568.1 serine/threonine-protein phosphatase [Spirosoma pollinicola]
MNELLIAGLTDVGQRRKDNQDTFICTPLWSESSALLTVIDGVGGYAGGDRAAAIAKESIERYMATPNGDPLSMLRESVVFANNQINEQREQDLRLGQMCCVLTAALADVSTSKLYFVHVGDTRLYRYRQGELTKLTQDHSLVGVREDANELTEAEAMAHPRRNEILRDVGSSPHRVDDPNFLDSGETDFQPGDQLLLCSDGLTDMITQAQIKAVLNRPISLDKQLSELVRVANHQGGNDNITVVLARNDVRTSEPAAPVNLPNPKSARSRKPPVVPVAPLVPAVEQPIKPEPVKRSSTGRWVLMGLVAICGIAGIVWYQSWPSATTASIVDSLNVAHSLPDTVAALPVPSLRLDSLLQTAHRSADHQLVLTDDTLRIDKPVSLTDSLLAIIGRNQLTVIAPRDSANSMLAMRVERRGTIQLNNLIISGFKTGIETTGEARLVLNKVYFKRVDLPVRAAIRQDTCLNTIISIAVQKQSVPTKPIHP